MQKKRNFLAKAPSSQRKAKSLGLKPRLKGFLCVLCGFARDAFDFFYYYCPEGGHVCRAKFPADT
jgi:hypothetical protein